MDRTITGEWLKEPFTSILKELLAVLNSHQLLRLGDIVEDSVLRNQRMTSFTLERVHHIFKPTRQSYIDEYDVGRFSWNGEALEYLAIMPNELNEKILSLMKAVIKGFAALSVDDINEHRTLEYIGRYVLGVIATVPDLRMVAFDFAEYLDQWRGASTIDRKKIVDSIFVGEQGSLTDQ